ncbi:MAG: hypothetical protein AAF515_16315 [Pseudomonadota bacterium]
MRDRLWLLFFATLLCVIWWTLQPVELLRHSQRSAVALTHAGIDLATRSTPEVEIPGVAETVAAATLTNCAVRACRSLPPRPTQANTAARELMTRTRAALIPGHAPTTQASAAADDQWPAAPLTLVAAAPARPALPQLAAAFDALDASDAESADPEQIAEQSTPTEIGKQDAAALTARDNTQPAVAARRVPRMNGPWLPTTTQVGLPETPAGRRQTLNCAHDAHKQWRLNAAVSHRAYEERLLVCRYPNRVTIAVDWRTSEVCAPALELSVGKEVQLARPVAERRRHDTDSIVLRFEDGHLLVRCENRRWAVQQQGMIALR